MIMISLFTDVGRASLKDREVKKDEMADDDDSTIDEPSGIWSMLRKVIKGMMNQVQYGLSYVKKSKVR